MITMCYEIDIEGKIELLPNEDLKVTSTVLTLEEAKKRIVWLDENSVLQLSTIFTHIESGELMFAGDFDYIDAFAMAIPEFEESVLFGGETLYYYKFLTVGQYIQLLTTGELILPLVLKE